MRKTPIVMLLAMALLVVAAYIVSYNNHTLEINNETLTTTTITE
ncbi:MAG: hypothetical protein ACRC1P_02370 [Cellulosilyticaceae bacterium]